MLYYKRYIDDALGYEPARNGFYTNSWAYTVPLSIP